MLSSHKRSASMGSSDQAGYSVLSIAPTSFFYDYGCHVRILEEALALRKLGHDVTICTYNSGNDVDGLDIRRTPPIPWRKGVEVGSSRHKIGFDVLLSSTVLATAVRRRPTVIHAHLHEGALIGAAVGALLRVPVVFDFQGSMTAEMVDHHFLRPDGVFYRLWRSLEGFIDHRPNAIITSSASAAPLLTNEFHCPPARVHIVPDGVNADVFRPLWHDQNGVAPSELYALRNSLGIPQQRKIVVYLGLIAEHQGTGALLQAAAQVLRSQPETHFLVMGFPNVEGYFQQAKALGLERNISFPGRIPYAQAPVYLALGDVAVSPKMSATEGAGKLLNYMAMGLPVVSFDTPVAREYLRDDGVYAPVGDTAAFAAAIAGLLRDDAQRAALGSVLRQRAVEEYSWRQMGRKIEAVYETVGARKQTAPRPDTMRGAL
jgi:glycosyltransferase involved in cell wall biosynthesis